MDYDIIIVGDFNTPLSATNRFFRKKINKETLELNHTLEQADLIDLYRTFYPTVAEHIFLKCTGTFSRRDRIGHKTNLVSLRRLKSYQLSSLITVV